MPYIRFFLLAVWYTLGATVICGLGVFLCRTLFVRMLGGGAGRGVLLATSIIGTPVHEMGHALTCLLFGHAITDINALNGLTVFLKFDVCGGRDGVA